MTSRPDRLLETMQILSNGMNVRLSQAIDSMVSNMHAQINRAINSAMNEKVNPEIQKISSNLPLKEEEAGTGTSTCHSDKPFVSNNIITKKDSRSAYDIRYEVDLGPYIYCKYSF